MTRAGRIAYITGWYILLLFISVSLIEPGYAAEKKFRNVIVMVPDGCSSAHTTISRWYKGSPLALDRMALGGVRTYCANSLITDSAPAATAFATGHKSSDKFIGVLPGPSTIPGAPAITEDLKYKPVATVLEGAKLTGKSVGMVVTVNMQHATPAAFSAHWPDRSDYNEIAKQQVFLGVDVVFGGGKKYLLPKEKGGTRTDGEDLIEVLRSKGYAFAETKGAMAKVKGTKVWGIFADDYMAFDFDRAKARPQEPSLAEMTQKAIEILSKNPKGFLLLVEGSKVDWASHAHDPVGVVSEVLAFDDAVGVALDFAKKDDRTLVLAFTDHGNGGMSVGSQETDRTYSKLSYEAMFGPLKKAILTGEGVEGMLGPDPSEEKIKTVVAEYYAIKDLSSDEIKALGGSKKVGPILGRMMSKRVGIGWTTSGHTGEDVFLYHYGYNKSLPMMENTGIAHMVARALGFDLATVDGRLFAPADKVFANTGTHVSIDKTNPANPSLIVERGGTRAELPLGKNIMRIKSSGTEYTMEGIAVLAPKTDKVYLPKQAATLFEKAAGR